MKLFCEGLDLSDAVLKVIKASSNKTINPILECVKLKATDEALVLTCTDGELAMEKTIKADVREEGECVVPGKLFSEFVKKLSNEQIELSLNEKNQLIIKYTDSEMFIACQDVKEFPTIQQIHNAQFFTLKQNSLKDIIDKTIFAVALDDTRPILKGCLFEAENKQLTSVALDGYRISIAKTEIIDCSSPISVIIPGRSLNELSKLLGDTDEPIRLLVQKNYLMVQVDSTKIITRLLGFGSDYINYKQIIPTTFETEVVIDKASLEDALDRASILARVSNDNSARFDFTNSLLTLSAKAEVGTVTEKINIALTGENLTIRFDTFFMREALRTVKDEFIKIKLNGQVSPCVITPHTGDDYMFLILPMKQVY